MCSVLSTLLSVLSGKPKSVHQCFDHQVKKKTRLLLYLEGVSQQLLLASTATSAHTVSVCHFDLGGTSHHCVSSYRKFSATLSKRQ